MHTLSLRHTASFALLLTSSFLFFGLSAAADPVVTQIEGYRDIKGKLATYTRDGQPSGQILRSDLPAPGAEATDETGKRLLYRVETSKGPVWLPSNAIRVKAQATIKTECERIERLAQGSAVAKPQQGTSNRALGNCKE